MQKAKRALTLALAFIFMVSCLSACGGTGIPNGRYEPVEPNTISAIEIEGNNFTMEMAGMMSTTVKYKYKDGVITFEDGAAGMNFPFEYRDGSLFLNGTVEFKKV